MNGTREGKEGEESPKLRGMDQKWTRGLKLEWQDGTGRLERERLQKTPQEKDLHLRGGSGKGVSDVEN